MTIGATAKPSTSFDASDIPRDWHVDTLSGLGGKATSGSRGWAAFYSNHGDLFVRITNMRRSNIHLDLSSTRFVNLPTNNTEADRTRVRTGDVLVSITADIGMIGYIDENLPSPAYINQHIARVRFPPDRVASKFIAYYLSSWASQKIFTGSTDTGAKAGINLIAVGALKTVVPPLAEQRHIAGVLTDIDNQIASLERIIAKKEAMRQGMVHQLLTGEIRLPSFTAAWSTHKLSELGSFLKGRGIKRDDIQTSGVACIRYGELYTTYRDHTSILVSFVDSNIAVAALPIRQGDLLFAGSGETRDEIGKCVAFTGTQPAVAGGDIVVLRAPDVNAVYLASLTNTSRVAAQKARLGQGDAVVHISGRALGSIEVQLPSLDEQDAIAYVLIDTDQEIRALNARLVKTKSIKQGMMQELLTGSTRLPVVEEETT